MNDMRDFDARIRKNPAWLTVDLYLSKRNPDGSQERVQSLVMEHLPREDVGLEMQPLRLSEEAAQHLMDDLWADGFRPASARYSSETLQAKEVHLQDARGLAKRLLDIVLGG